MANFDRVAQVLGPDYQPDRAEYAVFRRDKIARKTHDGWKVVKDYGEDTVICERKKKGGLFRAAQ